jgi:hypothetical protein
MVGPAPAQRPGEVIKPGAADTPEESRHATWSQDAVGAPPLVSIRVRNA